MEHLTAQEKSQLREVVLSSSHQLNKQLEVQDGYVTEKRYPTVDKLLSDAQKIYEWLVKDEK